MSEATQKAKDINNNNSDKKNNTVNNMVKEKISDNLSATAERFHSGADTAKEVLNAKTDKVEDFVRRKTYEAGDITQQTIAKANELGHKTADIIGNSSEYIKNFDYDDAKQTVKNTIVEKPQIGLIIAGVFGFLLGMLLGRKRN